LGRLDHYFQFLAEEVPFLAPRPSEHVRRQVYVTTHPLDCAEDSSLLTACFEAIGCDHLLFASDWPHFDATDAQQILDLSLPDTAKRGILGENARALFRFGT